MEYIIKNEYLQAVICSKGAELIRLIDQDKINRMHTPSPETWNRVSPILFPQISKTRDLLYKVNHKDYYMPMHGFFRNMELTPVQQRQNSITFSISDNEETWKVYPYHFSFSVHYELIQNQLKVSFQVTNKDQKILYYMLGGHPGFKVPLYDNEKYEDYSIKFPIKETIDAMQVVDGYLANVYKPCLNQQDEIVLNHDLFNPDAIVLKNLKSPYVDITSKNHSKGIRFHCSDFEILAIWSLMNEKAHFVCLEPWNGIQKQFVVDHEQMGVLSLKSNESKNYSYSIEVLN